jgi:hypothetical protein
MDDQRTDRKGRCDVSEAPKRTRFRFSLQMLLAITSLIAVGLGAYNIGHTNGELDGYRRGFDAASLETQAEYAKMPRQMSLLEMQRAHLEQRARQK